MSEKIAFETVLEKHKNMEATGITVPFDVEEVFGARKVPVKIAINKSERRTTIFRMDGKYRPAIPKVFREAAGVKASDRISVTLEKDLAERTVGIPEDFAKALKANNLTDAFAKMSYTHQKEYVNSINDAKKEETRLRRIEKACEMIGKK